MPNTNVEIKRPPKQWWNLTFKRVSRDYPRYKNETPEHYKAAISKIVGGIWRNYKQEVREKLLKQYSPNGSSNSSDSNGSSDSELKLDANPIPCPSCGNPIYVKKENVFLKCPKCSKQLLSVKVRRTGKQY